MPKKEVDNLKIFFSYAEADTEIAENLLFTFVENGLQAEKIFSYNTKNGKRLKIGTDLNLIKKSEIFNCDIFIQIYTHHTKNSIKSIQEYAYAEAYGKEIILLKHENMKTNYFCEESTIYMKTDYNSVEKSTSEIFSDYKITKTQNKSITDGIFNACEEINKKFNSKGSYHRYPFLRAILKKEVCNAVNKNLEGDQAYTSNSDVSIKNKKIIKDNLLLLAPEYPVVTQKNNNNEDRMRAALSHFGYQPTYMPEKIEFHKVLGKWIDKSGNQNSSWSEFTFRQIYSFFKEERSTLIEENNTFQSVKDMNKIFLPKVTRKDCDGEGNYEFHIYLIEFNGGSEGKIITYIKDFFK